MAITPSTAANAVDALLKWKNTQSSSGNPQLLPQDDFIYLILTLKKIPQKGGINGARTNPNKIPLPHPLISPNSFSEICLIIDDRPNSKLTSEIAKKKIKADGVSVTKVIKLSKLKTNYKPHEAKRKLCDSYEMFFADKRVVPLLPKLIGKQFFRKKKLPLGIDLTHKNWKEQIERGCSSGLLFFSTGTCCVIRVAKVSMERDEIVENVNAAIKGAIEFVPKKLVGVRSFHLKFSDSVALPLYQCLPDIKLKIEGKVKEEVEEMGNEKSLIKGRIHEVNHESDEKEDVENDESFVAKPTKKEKKVAKDAKKKRKGNVVEVIDDEQDEAIQNDELVAEEEVEDDELVVAKPEKKLSKEKNGAKDVDGGSGKKKRTGEKKRKGNVVEEDDVAKTSDKKSKKKKGDSTGKKEKKKGRSVARV
ncbi:putative ribosome biogenesis protein C8F11.04 [Rutidosis leptorrhynchoides]|uniref:putative ribosome biogenesis protein C8F11.04 n=1 Tax=Rutidosis leptorrhynchoides TaxID=125765 RepID=UPI003A9A39EA